MTDYGHDAQFGALLGSPDGNPLGVLDLAATLEDVGLDIVSLSDHPYWPERLDTMTLLAAIAARTTRVTVAVNLANLPLRPPTVLARTAATLDLLSNGRFQLGIATGARQFWDQITAEGGPRRDAAGSITALEEAIQIIRMLWACDGRVSFRGSHYRLDGVTPGPAPVSDRGIWVGAYRPRLLRVTGRLADGWVPSSPGMPPERLAEANRLVDEGAASAGRSPAAVRRVYNIAGEFTARGTGFLAGPPRQWAEQLTECALRDGMSVFLLYRVSSADLIRRFADEVVPAVREQVAAHRVPANA